MELTYESTMGKQQAQEVGKRTEEVVSWVDDTLGGAEVRWSAFWAVLLKEKGRKDAIHLTRTIIVSNWNPIKRTLL